MNDSKIPVRYAKALFELAEDKKITHKIYADILLIKQLVELSDVKDLLASPVVSSSKKNNAFSHILKGKVEDITTSFVSMVFQNKRETCLGAIARNFIDLFKKVKNIRTVEITTAVEMDEKLKDSFRSQILEIYNTDIDMVTKVNKDLVGGFVIQVDDTLYDASVKRQLKNIQHTLLTEKL